MERNTIRPNAGSRAFDTNIEEIKKAEATTRELSNIQQNFIRKFSAGEIISADELNKLHNTLQKLKDLSNASNDARIHFTEMIGQISETAATIIQSLQDSNHFDEYKNNIIECINTVKRLGESQLIIHSNSTETNIQLQKLIAIFNQLQQSAANDISLDPNIADNIFEKKEQLSDSFSTLIDTANKAELTNNALQEFYTILQGKLKDNSLLVGKLSKDISETNISINKSSKELLAASQAFKTDSIPNSFGTLYSGLQDIRIASNKMNLQLTSSGTVDKTIFEQFNEGLKQAVEGQTEVQKTIANELDNLNRPFLVHIVNSSNNALNAISQAKRVYEDTVSLSDKLHNDLHYDAIQMLRESKEHITNSTNEIISTIQTQTSDNIDNFFKALNESIHAGKTDLYTQSATGYNLGSNYMSAANIANQATENVLLKSMHLQDMGGAFNRYRLRKIEKKAKALAEIQHAIAGSKTNAMNQFQQMVNADSPDEKVKFKNRGEKTFSQAVEKQLTANLLAKELGEYIDEIVANGLIDLGKDGKAILSSIETVLTQNQAATRELMSAATNFHIEIDKDDMQALKEQYKELGKRVETIHKINVKYTDFTKYFSKARTDTIRSFKNVMNSIGNTLSKLGIHSFSFNILDYILKPFKYIEEQGRERYKTMGIDASVGVTDMATSASDTQQRLMEGNQLYAASGGMIDRGFINDMYKDLMKDVGGHYGGTPEQARSDVNAFVHQTYKIAAANGLDNGTMKDVFQTYYKDMRLSAEDAAGEFAKMMETAKNANVPIKQYMNMMNNLAKTFMKVGIKGTRADEVMQKLLMDGLRADIAQEVTQEAAGALSKESQDKNWVAYAASVNGMNPFEGLSRAAYSHEADGSERAGWADDMVKFADTRINTIAGAAGNDPNIMRMLVTDEFKNMGFSQRSASILTSSYMQGDKEQFKRLFSEESLAKDDPRAKLDKANKEAEQALTAMSGQLAESDKISAQLDAAMYKHAEKLSKVINDLIEQFGPILKKIQQALITLSITLLKAFQEFLESDTLKKIGKFLIESPIKAFAALISFTALEVLITKKAKVSTKLASKVLKYGAIGMILDDTFSNKKGEQINRKPTALDILIKGLDDTQKIFTGKSFGKEENKETDQTLKIVSSMGQTLKETMGLRKGKTIEESITETPSIGASLEDVPTDVSSTVNSLGSIGSSSSSDTSSETTGESSSPTSTSSISESSNSMSSQVISEEVSGQSSQSKIPVAAALKENIQIGEKMQGTPMYATSKETSEEKPNKQKRNKQKKPNTNIQTKGTNGQLVNMKDTTLSKDYQDIEMRRLGQLGMDKSAILANMQSISTTDTEDIFTNYPNKVIKGQPSQEKVSTPYANVSNINKYASINDYYKSFFDEEIFPKSSIKNSVELADKKIQAMSMTKIDKTENEGIKEAKEKEVELKNDESRRKASNSHASKVVSQNKKLENLSKIRNEDIIQFMKLNQSLYGNFQASVHIEHGNLWKKLNELEEVLKIINHNWIAYGKRWENVQLNGSESGTGNQAWNKKVLYMKFKAAGYSDEAIAGILGRVQQEHNFQTSDIKEHWENGLWVGGYGMFQWNGGRTQAFLAWCKQNNLNPQDPGVQADYAIKEAKERGLGPDYMNKLSVSEAADIWTRKWEVGVSGYEQSYAAQIYQEIKSGKIMNAQATNPARNLNRMSSGGFAGNSPTGTLMGIPLYRMYDERWGNKTYEYASGGGNSLAASGCGPTSFAMLAASHGIAIDPEQAAQMMKHMHMHGGTSHSGWEELAKSVGFSLRYTNKRQDVIEALRSGKSIIAAHGQGMFTGGGHYIVYAGMTPDGKVLVADPNQGGSRNKRGDNYAYSIDELLSDGGVSDWWIDDTPKNYSSTVSASYHGNYLDNSNLQAQTYNSAQSNMIGANNIGSNHISYVEKLQKEAEEKTKRISNSQLEQLKGLSEEEQIKKLYTMKGPNGTTYSKNDINYLVEQNYKAADIIKELSQSDTYKAKAKLPGEYDPNVFDLYRYGTNDITVQGNQVIVHSLTEQPYSTSPLALFSDNKEVILADGTRMPGWQANNLLRNMRENDPFLEATLRKQIDNDEIIEEGMKSYYRKIELNLNVQNSKEIFQAMVGNKLEQKLNDLQKKYEDIGTKFLTNEKANLANQVKQIKAVVENLQE